MNQHFCTVDKTSTQPQMKQMSIDKLLTICKTLTTEQSKVSLLVGFVVIFDLVQLLKMMDFEHLFKNVLG